MTELEDNQIANMDGENAGVSPVAECGVNPSAGAGCADAPKSSLGAKDNAQQVAERSRGIRSLFNGTGKARALIRALPLAVLDIMGTFVAFFVAAWGTQVMENVLASGGFGAHVALLALANVCVFAVFRMYNSLWEYASVSELARVVLAVTVGSLVGDVVGALLFGWRMPYRVYLCAWAVLLVCCGATRFALRLWSGRGGWSVLGVHGDAPLPRTLVVGAGDAGSLVVRRMSEGSPDVAGAPVAFVDDDPGKQGRYVHGIKVVGSCSQIPEVAREKDIEQIVVAVPSATPEERRRIFDLCSQTGCRCLTVPRAVKDMTSAEAGRAPLREVEVADLLAREEVELDLALVEGYLAGRRVLVTGGGGSIGSEIVRQLAPAGPAEICVFDVYENTAYELYHEMRPKMEALGIALSVEIGSITDEAALSSCFERHAPDVVFHAAAHKHVPLMEANPREAVANNVFGTLNVCRLAAERGCSHFVLISTDKAVNPTSVMGATKRMCEIVVQRFAAEHPDTVFAAVRFGNVLGSHGSVIPLFKRQLRAGGPITVTSREVTRYFMTIPEASRLVITAGAMARGGEIFVLDMGEPVRIWDLAENLVRLSGLTPGEDVQIVETGLRPGEKLYEELRRGDEEAHPTADGRITVISAVGPEVATARERIADLAANLADDASAKAALMRVVPTYKPQGGSAHVA